jgi:hypothetical protein
MFDHKKSVKMGKKLENLQVKIDKNIKLLLSI